MKIRQLSIFLENKVGRLAGVIGLLGKAGIDIRAISVADTADFGILRLLLKDVDRAAKVLGERGVVCRVSNVTVAEVSAAPGGLAHVLSVLDQAGVNIEYMYAVAQSCRPDPMMVFRFADTEPALKAMQENGIAILSEEELFA